MSGLRAISGAIRTHRGRLVRGLLPMGLAAAAGIALLGLSGWFVVAAGLAGAAGGTLNYLLPSAGIRFFAIARTALRYGERIDSHDTTLRVLATLRGGLFAHLAGAEYRAIRGLRGGEVLSRLTVDVETLEGAYLRLVGPAVVFVLATSATAVILLRVDPGLAGIALAGLGGLILAVLPVMRATRALGGRTVTLAADLRRDTVTFLQGLADLRAFGVDRAHARRVLDLSDRLVRAQTAQAAVTALPTLLTPVIAGGVLCCLLWIGADLVRGGVFDGAGLAFVLFLVLAVLETATPLTVGLLHGARIGAAVRQIAALPGAESAAPPPPAARRPPSPGPALGAICLDGVRFRHAPHLPWVLDGVDLRIAPGRHVLLTGASGAGKSSLFGLLLGLWPADHGRVLIGGQDVRGWAERDLHAGLAVLEQSFDLFAASIAENLRMGRPDASTATLWAVLEAVGLAATVRALPGGLDGHLGEAGLSLSGGERRRLALARTLLKDAPIILLDEPVEGLDAASAAQVWRAIRDWCAGRTLLVATHRPPAIGFDATPAIGFDATIEIKSGHAALIAREAPVP